MRFLPWYILAAFISISGVAVHQYRLPSTAVLFSDQERIRQEEPVATTTAAALPASTVALRIPIIIYHTVHPLHPGETRDQIAFNVPPDIFKEQLEYLRDNGYTTISLAQMRHDLAAGTTTVAQPVVLTFDDGWENQYSNAFPLLKQYGDIATFYIYTNAIGKDSRFLTWDELRTMSTAGMTIASHSLSHPYMSRLSDEALRHEIADSKAVLESRLNITVTDFASPFGYTSPKIEALVRAAGYATARTTYRGTMHSTLDLYHLTGYFAPQSVREFAWLLRYAQ